MNLWPLDYTNRRQPAEHITNSQRKRFPRPDYSVTLHDTIGCQLSQYNCHIDWGILRSLNSVSEAPPWVGCWWWHKLELCCFWPSWSCVISWGDQQWPTQADQHDLKWCCSKQCQSLVFVGCRSLTNNLKLRTNKLLVGEESVVGCRPTGKKTNNQH